MDNSPLQGFEIPYKLYRRFLSLVDSTMTLSDALRHVGYVRFKPLFATYNSCVAQFKKHYTTDYDQLQLEELPLYDDQGKMLFVSNKISTLLHQTQAIIGFLEGELPPTLLDKKERTTIVNVSSHADSQSAASSVAQLQAKITLDSLYQVIQSTEFNDKIKTELLEELKEIEKTPETSGSKIKSFATKLAKKLQEIGENVTAELLYKLISKQMGEM